MGLVFDKNTARAYESWYRSSQGQVIARSVEPLISALLRPRQGESVLDIGCGSGTHLLVLGKLGLSINGIDASSHMIKKSEQRLGQRCLLRVGMAEDLPFEDNAFDLAVFINSLEFMDDPLQSLREAGRVAKRKVFVAVLNSLSWNGLIKRVQGYFGDPLFKQVSFYNLWKLKSLVNQAYGPVPIQWECVKRFPSPIERIMPAFNDSWLGKHFPFGFFLGFSVSLVYRVKTDNLPLKIKIKKPGNSLVGASLEGLKQRNGDQRDERGIPV